MIDMERFIKLSQRVLDLVGHDRFVDVRGTIPKDIEEFQQWRKMVQGYAKQMEEKNVEQNEIGCQSYNR